MQRGSVLTALLLGACVMPAAEQLAQAEDAEDVRVEFRLEDPAGAEAQTFSREAAVRFVFRVNNSGAEPVRLRYTHPPHRVSVVAAQTGNAVWEAHHGRMFPQVMREQEIAPGESAEFAVAWDFRHVETGERVPAGSYLARAEFHAFLKDTKLPVELEPAPFTLR